LVIVTRKAQGVASGNRTAADLRAYPCFEDEAGQRMRPPKGRTWVPVGAQPVVPVRGKGSGRGDLADFAAEHADWLRIVQLPAYAPELNPVEGIWSLLRRVLANFVVADLSRLVRIAKRKLKKIQYRSPHLLTGCLTQTGAHPRHPANP
jgi:hypothetical protein